MPSPAANLVPFPIRFANLPEPAPPDFQSMDADTSRILGRALAELYKSGWELGGDLADLVFDLRTLLRSYPPKVVALRMGVRPELVEAWAAETRSGTSPTAT